MDIMLAMLGDIPSGFEYLGFVFKMLLFLVVISGIFGIFANLVKDFKSI